MRTPGFLANLQTSLEQLPIETLERVNRFGGLQIVELIDSTKNPKSNSVHRPDDVRQVQTLQSIYASLGLSLMSTDSVSCCIIVDSKSLCKISGTDQTLLTLKLNQILRTSFKNVWLMTPPALFEDVNQCVKQFETKACVKVFMQYETLLLTPDNRLHMNNGKPLLRSTGSGDLIHALKTSGMLTQFLDSGGESIVVLNSSNVAAFDPSLLGHHIENSSYITCEVTHRLPGESGDVLCHHEGVDQLVEDYRLDHAYVDEFSHRSTGTLVISAKLPFEKHQDMWHRVKRKIDGQLLVQYERLLNDLTSTFRTSFVSVNRHERLVKIDESLLCV